MPQPFDWPLPPLRRNVRDARLETRREKEGISGGLLKGLAANGKAAAGAATMRRTLIVAYLVLAALAAERAFAQSGTWSYVFGVITGGALLMAYAAAKSPFGLNFDPVKCPRCGTQQAAFRRPASFRQAMLGGFTCPNCGCDMDRQGKERHNST